MTPIGSTPSPRALRRHIPLLASIVLPVLMLGSLGCREDAEPPTAPADAGGPASSHAAGHKVVNSLADPGNGPCNATQCTLREAINDPGSTEISFAPGLTGSITLARPGAGGGTLSIDKRLSITGPSQRIVIRRSSPDPAFRIFRIGTGGTVTLANLTIRGNKEADPSSGILNRGTLRVTNSVVTEHSGGGIDNRFGMLTLANTLVVGNSGGGISVFQGRATLINTRIAGNSGSGIFISNAGVTLTNSTIAGNSAIDGGGVHSFNGGDIVLTNSTVVGNSASQHGGGFFNDGDLRLGASVSLTNSTVTGNSALLGGGVYSSGSTGTGVVSLRNSTVVRNSATQEGGGIIQSGEAVLFLTNSLVAQNRAPTGPDVLSDPFDVSARFNLIGDGSGSGITNTDGNQVGNVTPNRSPIDPRLGPLADNGGPTRTHALLVGSPAIDAASTPDCPTTDQRGVLRPQGAACDIGSYERGVQ
jgi:CSLREA domain-containing protein